MRADAVQLRRRGGTICILQTRIPFSELDEKSLSECVILTPSTSTSPSSSSSETYSTTLTALQASNENLEAKMVKLCNGTRLLGRDIAKLQQHIRSFQHELLSTWQADILTRLIEVVYSIQGWRLPGDVAPWESRDIDRWTLSQAYSLGAEKITRYMLWRKLSLPLRYHQALRKYKEIVEFRSSIPFRSECPFAQWLVSEKGNSPSMYAFWARLFPLCYNRSVEESSEIIPMK